MIVHDQIALSDWLAQGPYVGYCYSYPHKTSYRPLEPPRSLDNVWQEEVTDKLFLYVHIPFCEVRCGFCNLFTYSQPAADVPTQYLKAIDRHARAIHGQLPNARFSRLAIGGGTPSFLERAQMEQLFETLSQVLRVHGSDIPVSFEVSPSTIDAEKVECLQQFGVERVSMGIQSFNTRDAGSMGRPQRNEDVYRAIDMIRAGAFQKLNLDLIYGAEQQSTSTWIESLRETILCAPEEIYLYPLYVRPLTGLSKREGGSKRDRPQYDQRSELYREGRDFLTSNGYRQVSMRMFEKIPTFEQPAKKLGEPEYCCQKDGMIGLGCGARSYTSRLHYGSDYAVQQKSILRIIESYIQSLDSDYMHARHGFDLDAEERRRRYIILTLLLMEGLDRKAYYDEFRTDAINDFACLQELEAQGFATISSNSVQLNDKGIEWSDSIGPWLYSAEVRERMQGYSWND